MSACSASSNSANLSVFLHLAHIRFFDIFFMIISLFYFYVEIFANFMNTFLIYTKKMDKKQPKQNLTPIVKIFSSGQNDLNNQSILILILIMIIATYILRNYE